MYKFRSLFTALYVSVNLSIAHAGTLYSLVDKDDVVLATMELAELPANHADIVSLAFTESGQDMFGLGSVYSGTFDTMGGPNATFLDDSDGGLTGFDANGSQFATAYDNDPPQSSVAPSLLNPRFAITATIFDEDFVDELVYDFGNGVDAIVAQGRWQLVPEPSSRLVLSSGLLLLCSVFRKTTEERHKRRGMSIRERGFANLQHGDPNYAAWSRGHRPGPKSDASHGECSLPD